MAGGVSLEDWSRRTETVSPQRDEHCGCQSERDSAVCVKSDGNDIELNVETDDEDMEDEETRFANGSAQVRNIRDPGQPTANENKEHITTHRPYRSWCKFSVTGRGVNSPHRRSDAQEDWEGVPHVSMDCGFLGERESEEQVNPMVVSRERRHKMTCGRCWFREREPNFPGLRSEQLSSLNSLGTTESRSDATTNRHSRHGRGKSHGLVKRGDRLFLRDRQWEKASPTGSLSAQWDLLPARPEH